MYPRVKLLIKSISSNYVRADIANQTKNHNIEAKYLMFAIKDCNEIITLFFSGDVDRELAATYAHSATNSAKRIEEIMKRRALGENELALELISRERAESAVPLEDCSGQEYSRDEREDLIRCLIYGAEIQRDKDFETMLRRCPRPRPKG